MTVRPLLATRQGFRSNQHVPSAARVLAERRRVERLRTIKSTGNPTEQLPRLLEQLALVARQLLSATPLAIVGSVETVTPQDLAQIWDWDTRITGTCGARPVVRGPMPKMRKNDNGKSVRGYRASDSSTQAVSFRRI